MDQKWGKPLEYKKKILGGRGGFRIPPPLRRDYVIVH